MATEKFEDHSEQIEKMNEREERIAKTPFHQINILWF